MGKIMFLIGAVAIYWGVAKMWALVNYSKAKEKLEKTGALDLANRLMASANHVITEAKIEFVKQQDEKIKKEYEKNNAK
jgi:hypothetical protein